MMKQEFEKLVQKQLTIDEWDVIEAVYMNYPGIDKEKTVKLYELFGMVIFYDMYKRAKVIKEFDEEIWKLTAKKHKIMKGGDVYDSI